MIRHIFYKVSLWHMCHIVFFSYSVWRMSPVRIALCAWRISTLQGSLATSRTVGTCCTGPVLSSYFTRATMLAPPARLAWLICPMWVFNFITFKILSSSKHCHICILMVLLWDLGSAEILEAGQRFYYFQLCTIPV